MVERASWLSVGRISWMLPVASWALYASLVVVFSPFFFNDIFTPVVLACLSGVCFVLAIMGLGGRHKVSAWFGFLLNGVVVGGVLWVMSNLSFAVKF